jgi:hypothetical protein
MSEADKVFLPGALVTAIGSFPHRDPAPALELIERYLPEAPAWPQLPRRGFRENMCAQFSRGMPALVLDEQKERIFLQVGNDLLPRLEEFYQEIIEDNLDYFALDGDFAPGFRAFRDYLRRREPAPYAKGCVTGPITFGLTITDQDRKPSLYHPELFDAITKTITAKARWQIRELAPFCGRVIIFIDEPYMSSVGSALVSLKEEEVVEKLNEVIDAIHGEGGLAGIHCCANTDWAILLSTSIDILSFDAYGYAKNLLLYERSLRKFIERGGALAWGITPSSREVEGEDLESLWEKLMVSWQRLEKAGWTRRELLDHSLLTPSCGMGTLTPELAEKILRLTDGLSRRARGEG